MNCGIYKISNSKNDKVYIGQSTDITRRWRTHRRDAIGISQCAIHCAMRELGTENFVCEEIEEVLDLTQMNDREMFYIIKYNSLVDGYNEQLPMTYIFGENNPLSKMTEIEVATIRRLQAELNLSRAEIYKRFSHKITLTNFLFICKYQTWPHVLPELNTDSIMNWHKTKTNAELGKFSEEELLAIFEMDKKRMTRVAIAKIMGVHPKTIGRIFTGRYYKKEVYMLLHKYPHLSDAQGSTTMD